MKNLTKYIIFLILIIELLSVKTLYSNDNDNWNPASFHANLINIRNSNGKLYAYIVLLFNENPHFVNLIQEDSITQETMKIKNYHISAYKNYLKTIKIHKLKKRAKTILNIFLNPDKYSKTSLNSFEKKLEQNDIVIRFSKSPKNSQKNISLDYCIYGKRNLIVIKHPHLKINEKIFNIRPFIYYDEFSTSNSTFYFDMIYINPEEVENDYIISRRILSNKPVESMFFVGARISEDIKYCLKKSFNNKKSIKNEIWKMFEVHEITHKILNNHYNFYDQVTGEELALSSTVFENPYLGLAVMYSYLDYNAMNPHRIGALNLIRFIAKELKKPELLENPSKIKNFNRNKIKKISRLHFFKTLEAIKKQSSK